VSDLLVALLTIPLVTAFIGYITNWAAVKMIFHPAHFVGVGPIGWQGVLPGKADMFAHEVADTMSERVLSARDLAERASELGGVPTSFLVGSTGAYGGVGWITACDTLAELQHSENAVNSDPSFIEFLDEQGAVFQPGATQVILQRIH
jgi:hypothetical protein